MRFSTSGNNNSIVVQAKHYVRSSYSQLKHVLLRDEKAKIKNLKPNRYIVVTSLSLTPTRKDELKAGLSPFVQTSNDIIGRDDLNSFLSEFPEIEKRYFKLWFSSVPVINRIINNGIEGRSQYLLEEIKAKFPQYVTTKNLFDADSILQRQKILLITGQPGIGKTTLAKMLIFDRARNGCAIYQVENITEAENLISINNAEKQLFYFDDFLGANYYEIVNAHKTETQLTRFIERIKTTPNKYLILTTRTIILNHAIEKYEKIAQSSIVHTQFEIKLTDYSKYEKAIILYNHIYFSDMQKDLYDVILRDKFYLTIVSHKNYSPRIIEFITDKSRILSLTTETYRQFILGNLDNPKDIWYHSFNNQISYLDRCLLFTLLTFESGCFYSDLSTAYASRLEFERNNNNQTIHNNQCDESIRILLNGFIISYLYNTCPPVRKFSFINPSLGDFLIRYIAESFDERKGIISSLVYLEQLSIFNPDNSVVQLEKELQDIICQRIAASKLKTIREKGRALTSSIRSALFLEAIIRYCPEANKDSLLLGFLKQISFSESWKPVINEIEYFLLSIENSPKTHNYVKNHFIMIIEKLMTNITDSENAKIIPTLFRKYEYDYDDYIESPNGLDKISNVIESVVEQYENELIDSSRNSIGTYSEVIDLYYDINAPIGSLVDTLLPRFIGVEDDYKCTPDREYWDRIIEDNIEKAELEYNQPESSSRIYKRDIQLVQDEGKMIEDLFSGELKP